MKSHRKEIIVILLLVEIDFYHLKIHPLKRVKQTKTEGRICTSPYFSYFFQFEENLLFLNNFVREDLENEIREVVEVRTNMILNATENLSDFRVTILDCHSESRAQSDLERIIFLNLRNLEKCRSILNRLGVSKGEIQRIVSGFASSDFRHFDDPHVERSLELGPRWATHSIYTPRRIAQEKSSGPTITKL
jgi:hypothetical protein